jgi:hypothetical protein
MSNHPDRWRRSFLDTREGSSRNTVLRYPTREYQTDDAVDHDTLTQPNTPCQGNKKRGAARHPARRRLPTPS